MTDTRYDRAPGDGFAPANVEEEPESGVLVYTIGLLLAVILTAMSFWVANTSLLWAPGVSLGLTVLAIAQMGSPSGVLPARHHRAGQHQQRDGAGIRRADCGSGRRWLAVDHGRSERSHDAGRVDELAYAALSGLLKREPKARWRFYLTRSRPGLPLRSASASVLAWTGHARSRPQVVGSRLRRSRVTAVSQGSEPSPNNRLAAPPIASYALPY